MKKLNFLSILLSALLVSGSVWGNLPKPSNPSPKDRANLVLPDCFAGANVSKVTALDLPVLKKSESVGINNTQSDVNVAMPSSHKKKLTTAGETAPEAQLVRGGTIISSGTFAAMLADAQANDEIQLLTDIYPESTIIIDKDITLNLGEYDINANTYLEDSTGAWCFEDADLNYCVIKITNSVNLISKGGIIDAPLYGHSDQITEKGGKYGLVVVYVASGSLIMKEVTIEGGNTAINGSSASITLNGGAIKGGFYGIDMSDCNLYINEGVVTNIYSNESAYTIAINNVNGYVEINDGQVIATGTYGLGVYNSFSSDLPKLVINGGEVSGSYQGVYNNAGNVELKGGIISATNGCALLDVSYNGYPTDIKISNGKIICKSNQYAFNSSNYPSCSLNISGGTISNIYNYGKTTISGGRIAGTIDAPYHDYSYGKLDITGGVFDYKTFWKYTGGWVNPEYEKEGYHFVEVQLTEDETQKTAYEFVKDPDKEARIGDTKYEHLSDALAAAQANDVVYLLKNIQGNVTVSKNITLNIASYNIEGTLTASDATVMVDGKGTIDALSGDVKIIRAFTKVDPTNYLATGSIFTQESSLYRVYPEKVAALEVAGVTTNYETIVEAFANLPENSTPATVTLLADEYMEYVGQPNTVAKYNNVTLDLNGYVIYGTNDYGDESSAVVVNYGTITVLDGSTSGKGAIYNSHTNPEDWKSMGKEFPAHAYNIFSNYGTLIIESGYFESAVRPSQASISEGYACYVVDNYSGGELIVKGGKLYNANAPAIRQFCTSETAKNDVTINGGEVIGYYGVWIQLPGRNSDFAPLGSFTMNGGELSDPWANYALYDYSYGNKRANISITFTGGDIRGSVFVASGSRYDNDAPTVSISGGRFHDQSYCYYNNLAGKGNITQDQARCISGGFYYIQDAYLVDGRPILTNTGVWSGYIMHGYEANRTEAAIAMGPKYWEIAPLGSITVNGQGGDWNDQNTWTRTTGEGEVPTTADIVTITGNGTGSFDTVRVYVESGDTAVANTVYVDGEGQIVVKDGATLQIGNGGIVTDNEELLPIIVEAGGVLTVGTGGVDKEEGTLTPITITHDTEKSGVFMVEPNAPASLAEAEATVNVFVRSYKNGSIEHWQHMATPVKGSMSIKPDKAVRTQLFQWNYDTDEWEYVPGTPTAKGIIEPAGWSGSNLLEPFRAYDLINTSLPADGGVSYEFKGNLVGNEDMMLNFPEHGYCIFGNSYTAAIDLNTFFEKVINDMPEENVDPCVYIFNSLADRYESVNALDLYLKEIFEIEPAFTQIPPQQAFVMNLRKGNTAQTSVDYAKNVWKNQNSSIVDPIRAPRRFANTNIDAYLDIRVSDGTATDKLVLVAGNTYDENYNAGADAEKYMNSKLNVYATTEAGKLGMLATDNIDGTMLTVETSNGIEYTMTFAHVMGEYLLIDHETNQNVAIQEGVTYSFVANANSKIANRFEIVADHTLPTDIKEVKQVSKADGIYTMLGQYVGSVDKWISLPAGVYVINGVKIVK